MRFYRSFKCSYRAERRFYSLGDLCWIKSSREAAVCILQIHTLWEKISNSRMFAGGRLFFRPEDTPKGRYPSHGQVCLSHSCLLRHAMRLSAMVHGHSLLNSLCFFVFSEPAFTANINDVPGLSR